MSKVLFGLVLLLVISTALVSANKDGLGNERDDGKPNPEYKGMCTGNGGCNSTCGKQKKWLEPSVTAAGACKTNQRTDENYPYCYAASKKASECCNACRDMSALGKNAAFRCKWWLFIPTGTTCQGSECGKCYLFPPNLRPAFGAGGIKGSKAGKVCPYTKNDPHFLGAQGTRFEFNGLPDKSFCLYTDKSIHINMKMTGYYDTRTVGASIIKDGKAIRTWIRELAIFWHAGGATHHLVLAAREGKEQERGDGFLAYSELDSTSLPTLEEGQAEKLPGGLTFTYVGVSKSGPFDVETYNVAINGLLDMDIALRVAHPLLQTSAEAMAHINVQFNEMAPSSNVHGIIGQTYRQGREKRAIEFAAIGAMLHRSVAADGESGQGFLDGLPKDYETSDVMKTDCKFTSFNGKSLPANAV